LGKSSSQRDGIRGFIVKRLQCDQEFNVDAVVGTATLAPTTEQEPLNISDWRYLEEMYQLGAEQYFDAVGAMAYGFDSSPLDRNVDEQILNFSRSVGLRELMLKYEDAEKAIWITDWGWNSLPINWQGNPFHLGMFPKMNKLYIRCKPLTVLSARCLILRLPL
jgi:hypothetical protein